MGAFRQSMARLQQASDPAVNAVKTHGRCRFTVNGEGTVRVLHPGSDSEEHRDGGDRKARRGIGEGVGGFEPVQEMRNFCRARISV